MSKVIRVLLAPLLALGLVLGSAPPAHGIVVFAAWSQLYRFERLVRRCMIAMVAQEMIFIGTAEGTFQKLINWIMLSVALGTNAGVIGDLQPLSEDESQRYLEDPREGELFNQKLPQINAAIDLLVSEVSKVMEREGDISPEDATHIWKQSAQQYQLTEYELKIMRIVILKRSHDASLKAIADKS